MRYFGHLVRVGPVALMAAPLVSLSLLAAPPATAHQAGPNPDRLTRQSQRDLSKFLKPEPYQSAPLPQPVPTEDLKGKKKSQSIYDFFSLAMDFVGEALVSKARAAVAEGTKFDLKVLVIAADGNEPSYAAITSALDHASVPYDTLLAASDPTLQTSGCDLVAALYVGATSSACATTNYGRYQGVILTTNTLVYCPGSGCQYAMGSAAWTALAAYEKHFSVREASLYTIPGGWRPNCLNDTSCPSDTLGLVPATGPNGAAYQDTTATPIQDAMLSATGAALFNYINVNNPLSIKYAWTYFAGPVDSSTKSLLTASNGALLAATYAYPDGRESLALTMDQNPSLIHSIALGYGVINWVTKGLFLGERQVSLLAQPDDILIDAAEWDASCPSLADLVAGGYLSSTMNTAPSGYSFSQKGCTPTDVLDATTTPSIFPYLVPNITAAIYKWYQDKKIPIDQTFRMSGADFVNIVNWQKGVRGATTTAAFRIEWPFNGFGTTAYANDTLTPAVKSYQNQFNWISHTYDHQDLQPAPSYPNANAAGGFSTAITASFVQQEWTNNDYIARNVLKLTNYNRDSVIHPGITGLDYYNTMLALGPGYFNASYSVSDTSVPVQKGVYPNTGWWNHTAVKTNSMLEIPRYPLNLYYNVTTPDEWVSEYNYFYGPGGSLSADFWGLGRNVAYNEILDHESDTWLLRLLRGDQAPTMAHQTNFRSFAWNGAADPNVGLAVGGNHTLLGDLINAVLVKYNKIYTLPIQSPSLHDLGAQFKRRTDRYLNRSGVTATYVQGLGVQNIQFAYTTPAATGSATSSSVSQCDPGYRPVPGPGSDLRALPCSTQNTAWTWYTATTKSSNPNPARSVTVPLTGVQFGSNTLAYGGQTTSYVAITSGAPVNVSVPTPW
jgi:hypothetical protein